LSKKDESFLLRIISFFALRSVKV